jgi:tetratricopeptide (TPR) repeat protein
MKVFISSTYKDLIDYRKAAIRAVEGTNYQAGKMEVFGARSEEPVEACLKEVAECDLFIGIYALRYGFVPDGSDISITEMEYIHAKKLGKEIYCFLLDEENQGWLTKWMDDEPGKTKLKDFKQRVQSKHICDYFTTSDDLRAKVANAFSHFVANHNGSSTSGQTCPLPKPTGNSLPREGFFVGREAERKIIAEALSPESRTWGALIDGPGGIGKTALAIKAAHEALEGLFERKIFISAKVRELTTDGEKPLTDFTRPTWIAMLDELGKELGEENLERLAPDERPNVLRLALAGKKALIVFDNLETLPEAERTRLFQFLSRLPDGNKAIVTSRRRADVDARIVRLDRLSRAEAMALIAELAKKYQKLARASENERDELYGMTHGNPLLIRWIAGQLGREGSQCRTIADACAFIEKAPKGNDPLEYIFGDLLETFSPDETLVLAALTYFTKPAKLKWLAQMTGLPERAAETALEDLTDRAILISDLEARTFYLPQLAAQFIKTRRPEEVRQTGDALVNRAYAMVMELMPSGGWYNHEGFYKLDVEWDFLSVALKKWLMGDNERLQTVCDHLHIFLEFTGRWEEVLWLYGLAEVRALTSNNKELAGWRAYKAGLIYCYRNQLDQLRECNIRVAEYWYDSTPRNKAFAFRLCGLGFKLNKEYQEAIAILGKALEIWRSIDSESDEVAIALNDLADVKCAIKDFLGAERDYREALRIAKKVNYQEEIALISGNLAYIVLDREQWVEAESLAREALKLAETIERQDVIARDSHSIAKALFKQNKNLEEALTHIRRAVEIYTYLCVPDDLQNAHQTLAEIEKAMSGE